MPPQSRSKATQTAQNLPRQLQMGRVQVAGSWPQIGWILSAALHMLRGLLLCWGLDRPGPL